MRFYKGGDKRHQSALETSILTALIAYEDQLLKWVGEIPVEAFYYAESKDIFQAIKIVFNTHGSINEVSLMIYFREMNYDIVNSRSKVNQLFEESRGFHMKSRSIKNEVETLIGLYKTNLAISTIEKSLDLMKDDKNIKTAYKHSNTLIDELYEIESSYSGKKELVANNAKDLEDAVRNAAEAYNSDGCLGVRTGIENVDSIFRGLQSGQFYILAARPSMGKTCLSINLAEGMVKNGYNVVYFSLEMSSYQMMSRRAEVNTYEASTFYARGEEGIQEYLAKKQHLTDVNLRVIDMPSIDLNFVRSALKRCSLERKVDAVFVDYIQLMTGKGGNRENEVSKISGGLKGFSKEFDCPVVALAQLNRECEKTPDKRPMLSHLRESGSIEQDADAVMMLYRPDYYDLCHKTHEGYSPTELLIHKNRMGEVGSLFFMFDGQKQKFNSCDDEEYHQATNITYE